MFLFEGGGRVGLGEPFCYFYSGRLVAWVGTVGEGCRGGGGVGEAGCCCGGN